eukprot:TRINITY_DN140_c0_g1_i1.p1 TRINITY_DN140_c0_g1~~TRINITY_DN140_c0_g1_i1.p1  ORF type:complete len:506 (+),score=96.06 TRINITY_DN140_c0_g1_i1:175-1692(+)
MAAAGAASLLGQSCERFVTTVSAGQSCNNVCFSAQPRSVQTSFRFLSEHDFSFSPIRNAPHTHIPHMRSIRCHASGGSATTTETEETEQRARLTSLGGVMTDETVPEGHKGLHGFLYGEGSADVHAGDDTSTYSLRAGEDDGSLTMPVEAYVTPREARKLAGVYAVYNATGALQYVGYSRNVVLSIKAHRATRGEATCAAVRVKVYADAALVSRSRLEEERQRWLQEAKEIPTGNGAELALWEGPSGPGTAAMNESEREVYEQKKLKMRKAMGENLHDEVEGETEDSKTRRMKLLQAIEGDDWSGVIDGQTKETLSAAPLSSRTAGTATVTHDDVIVSPFARPGAVLASASSAEVSMTVETVTAALDEVRPYLIADGGDVEVVDVIDGVVRLRLQGACGTCPSSTSTMKMGIERSLRNAFGERLREVVQVDKMDLGASVAGVDGLLDTLRPAIKNFKGKVEVVSVDVAKALCQVKYKGPPPVGMGIQAAIKDKFPDILTVELVPF